jgi:hypothetical protein
VLPQFRRIPREARIFAQLMDQHNQHLDEVLARLDPSLDDTVYVFVSCSAPLTEVAPFAMVREDDRFSYIVSARDAARAGLHGDYPCRRLELGVDTELSLVGFIARIAAELALHGIPVNPLAGHRRDHLLIPVERANDALKVLRDVAARARLIVDRQRAGNGVRIQPISDGIWTVDGPIVHFFGMPYPTRMTLIRLRDGTLFVHSPVALDESLVAEVASLGAPRHLIAPNKLHHLFIADWVQRFPAARVYAAPGMQSKLAGIDTQPLDAAEPPPWHQEIDQLTFRGSPLLQEVVFLHRASRTLIVADLIENFDPATLTGPQRLLARLVGILAPRGSMPRDWRLSFVGRGKRTARDCALAILAWQPEAVLMAHGRAVTAGAQPFLQQALKPFVPA